MVIDQIDIPNMSIVQPKNNAPVRANRDAPETLEPAFEWMKPEAGKIHIRRNPGAAQNGEDVFDLLDHVGLKSSPFAVNKKSLESLVSKSLDHARVSKPTLLLLPGNRTVTSDALQS